MSDTDDRTDSGEVRESIQSGEGFRTRHDGSEGRSISESVVSAVAAVTGKLPGSMAPLYSTVDPDALDQLAASVSGDGGLAVAFTYETCRVTVRGNGEIEVRATADDLD